MASLLLWHHQGPEEIQNILASGKCIREELLTSHLIRGRRQRDQGKTVDRRHPLKSMASYHSGCQTLTFLCVLHCPWGSALGPASQEGMWFDGSQTYDTTTNLKTYLCFCSGYLPRCAQTIKQWTEAIRDYVFTGGAEAWPRDGLWWDYRVPRHFPVWS